MAISPAPPAPLMLIIPPPLLAAWTAPDPAESSVFGAYAAQGLPGSPAPAKPDGGRPGTRPASPGVPGVWVAGSELFMASAVKAAGQELALQSFPTLAALVAAVYQGPAPALAVVEVPTHADFQLDLVAAIRRHPNLRKSALIVALEAPTRKLVLRCAALGIVDVIPATLEVATLSQRLSARARQTAGRATRLPSMPPMPAASF
jgi:CheY-like chemotaxis protein